MKTDEEILEAFQKEAKIARLQMLNMGLAYDLKDKRNNKIRTITFYKQYAYTMDCLSESRLQLIINLEKLKENPVSYTNKIIKENNYLLTKIIAIALLNSRWKINLFCKPLTWYLRSRIKSEDLKDLADIINELGDAENFLLSTVTMAGADRTTKPKAEQIELNPEK